MKYEVYLDTVFLIQFVLNYCVLMLTASFMKLITSRLRIILAALIGAGGSCLMFLPGGSGAGIKFVIIFGIITFMMIRVAFHVRGYKLNLLMFLTILTVIFLLGGVTQWVVGRLGVSDTSWLWLAFIIAFYNLLQFALKQYRRQKSHFVPVTIDLGMEGEMHNKVSVIALIDSGNRLREETTGKPVCILENDVFKIQTTKNYEVTYHSLGNREAKMQAIIVPEIVIHFGEGDLKQKEVMIASYPEKITKKGSYHMILHPAYLKED
ncbi:MAG: sigma-E processing peptidase SpoIIGA [Lachnospiraceae bacterium]|nr:sigma-E processing peptidase SpoIIGA [Lachnospiraceae bacterium]